MHDPISDMLTRIRNAGQALHPTVTIPHSQVKESLAQVLQREGYVTDIKVEGDKVKTLTLGLKYDRRKSVIVGLRRISTPGLRRYVQSREIPRVLGGMGICIVSTPKGLLTGAEARRQNLGGELICYVW